MHGLENGIDLFAFSDYLTSAVLLDPVQEDELKESGLKQGGVLTPATAMGMVLVRRIQKSGVSFDLQ